MISGFRAATVSGLALVFLGASASPAVAASAERIYVNEKYGYQIAYPADFIAHGAPDAGDGQRFTSPRNDAQLLVFTSPCVKGESASPYDFVLMHSREQRAGKLALTYNRHGKNFAVVSGTIGTRIFYRKLLILDQWCTQFSFEYERSRKERYDAATVGIAASFKP